MSTKYLANTKDLRGLLLGEIESIFLSINESPYWAKQFFKGLHRHGAMDINDIPLQRKETRDFLRHHFELENITISSVNVASDGTRKYQFTTHDGHMIESVFLLHAAKHGRHSICISSQVGCAMGCTFCATAKLKLARHLTASEIISQVYLVAKDVLANVDSETLGLSPNERPIRNIVFMGMGEPLHNFDNVLRAIHLLSHPDGMAFCERRITVSTSGLVPKIAELGEKTGVYLAISLNATTDEVRNLIMPVNNRWRIESLLMAARNVPHKFHERITFEYVLLKGINDSEDDAHRLVELLKDIDCKINLIPFNEHPLSPYQKPDNQTILRFHQILYQAHLAVFTRKTRGDDIDAACGMLGAKALEQVRKVSVGS